MWDQTIEGHKLREVTYKELRVIIKELATINRIIEGTLIMVNYFNEVLVKEGDNLEGEVKNKLPTTTQTLMGHRGETM